MKLIGVQFKQIQEALLAAFDEAGLRQMVRVRLDEDLPQVAGGQNLTEIVSNLVTWAERQNRVQDLINAALTENPHNTTLEVPMSDSSRQEQKTVRPAVVVIALTIMALLLSVVVLRQQSPAPKGVDAPSDQFSAGRVQVLLKEILAEGGPHWAGSEQNHRVRQRIVSAFESLGYGVEVQERVVCREWAGAFTSCGEVQNIVTRLPGREAGPALMLAAHYDSVPAGEGVADDGHAVASILEMARILKEQGPHRNSIVFLLTDSEEIGMLGAEGFVANHPWMRDVAVVLNLEARGTSGQSYMFETSEENGWLVDAYASTVRQPASSSLHYEIYRILPNDTDLTIFRAGGLAGLNFAFIDRVSHYHTPLDSFENLDFGSVQHQGDSVLAVVQELAEVDLDKPPSGNAAWTDLLGFTVVRWPASWTIPLSVLALLLLLTAAARLMRRHMVTTRGLLLGLLAAFVCLLTTVLLGLGLTWVVGLVASEPSPWYAYPLPMRIALWAAALLSGGLVATGWAGRAGAWGLAVGAGLWWALLALTLGIVLPGAAITLLLPTLVMGVVFAIVAFTRLARSVLARELAFIGSAVGAGIIWFPLSLAFESAVSFDLSPIVTIGLGLVASTLAPLFAVPQARTRLRRGLLIASAAAVFLATGIASFVPPFSAASPQQVNITHFDDVSAGTAYWTGASFPGAVREPLRSYFDANPIAIFPWNSAPVLVASAQVFTAPAPDLEVLSQEVVTGERMVKAQLRSLRGADLITLQVPVAALNAVIVADKRFVVTSNGAANGYYTLQCYGRACNGLVVQLHLKEETPVEVLVTDFTVGLPPDGESLLQARSPTGVPVDQGDQTIIMKRVVL
jgi:hypothetical protein